jgi:hypothetical protein
MKFYVLLTMAWLFVVFASTISTQQPARENLRQQPERLPQIEAEPIKHVGVQLLRQVYSPPDGPTDLAVKVGDVLTLEPFADAKDMDIQLAGWTHSGPLNYLRSTTGKVFFHAEKEGRVRFVLVLTERGSPVKDKLTLYTVTVNEQD